jgi:hypothetical protein
MGLRNGIGDDSACWLDLVMLHLIRLFPGRNQRILSTTLKSRYQHLADPTRTP